MLRRLLLHHLCVTSASVALGLYELIMDDPEIKPVIENIYRVIFGATHGAVQQAHTRVWQWTGGEWGTQSGTRLTSARV